MDFVETEGDTIDAAIENALKMLGVDREKVTIEIVSEGRKGILGFGAQRAKIRAELRKSPVSLKTPEKKPSAGEAFGLVLLEAARAGATEVVGQGRRNHPGGSRRQ